MVSLTIKQRSNTVVDLCLWCGRNGCLSLLRRSMKRAGLEYMSLTTLCLWLLYCDSSLELERQSCRRSTINVAEEDAVSCRQPFSKAATS